MLAVRDWKCWHWTAAGAWPISALHGRRLLDCRQPRHRSRRDQAADGPKCVLFAAGFGHRDHGAVSCTARAPDAAFGGCGAERPIRASRSAATTGRSPPPGRTDVAPGRWRGPRRRRRTCRRAAIRRLFAAHIHLSCEEIVAALHRTLAPTRGAAVAVARVDMAARAVRFVGVGNIAPPRPFDGARHMASHNGTAGHVAPRIREFTYDFDGSPLVILHSDGLATRWDIAAYPGLP